MPIGRARFSPDADRSADVHFTFAPFLPRHTRVDPEGSSEAQFDDDTSPSFAGNTPTRIVARSFYEELREHGYAPRDLLAITVEIVSLVTRDVVDEQ